MYDADGRADILDAILDYLDDSIVLPPGEWDKKTLLPIIDRSRKKAAIEKADIDKDAVDGNSHIFILKSILFGFIAKYFKRWLLVI